MIIDRNKEKIISPTKRAPREREAPLPSRGPNKPSLPEDPDSKLDEVFKKGKGLSFDQNTGFHSGPSAKRKGYRLAMWSFLASIIDGLILIAISCVFMVMFSLVVHSPFAEVLKVIQHSQHRLLFFAEVMMGASWLYLIAIRGLMGASIGEWACNLRLGQPHERLGSFYILKVAFRSTLILLTGVIVLPFLSMLFGRDVAGIVTGLKLFSLK
ncbi:hypothetical protein D3C87_259680 [compost metagenome]